MRFYVGQLFAWGLESQEPGSPNQQRSPEDGPARHFDAAARQDGPQASGGGRDKCTHKRRLDLVRTQVYFLHFHQDFSRLRQKGRVITQVGGFGAPHTLSAPDGLMHNLCTMQGAL